MDNTRHNNVIRFVLCRFNKVGTTLYNGSVSYFFLFTVDNGITSIRAQRAKDKCLVNARPMVFRTSTVVSVRLKDCLPIIYGMGNRFILVSLYVFKAGFIMPMYLCTLADRDKIRKAYDYKDRRL